MEQCLAKADLGNTEVAISYDRLAQAEAQLDEARLAPYFSSTTIQGWFGPAPEFKATMVYSPSSAVVLPSSRFGLSFGISFDSFVPVWTFGKISGSVRAAQGRLGSAAADAERTRLVVRHDVRRAWFAYKLAQDARYLLEQARSRLDEALGRMEQEPDTEESDLLRMRTYRLEVEARLGEVSKGERLATAGLRVLTGLGNEPIRVADDPIAPPRAPLLSLHEYLRRSELHRPELRKARAKVLVSKGQHEMAVARSFPELGIATNVFYALAPAIGDQVNPFVGDGANAFRFSIGLGGRFNLDFVSAAPRLRASQEGIRQAESDEAATRATVESEVRSAHATAVDAQTRVKFYGEAERLARRWVAVVSAAISVGTKEDRDITDPLRTYLVQRFNHLQAIMDLDVAVSSLALSTGDEDVARY